MRVRALGHDVYTLLCVKLVNRGTTEDKIWSLRFVTAKTWYSDIRNKEMNYCCDLTFEDGEDVPSVFEAYDAVTLEVLEKGYIDLSKYDGLEDWHVGFDSICKEDI